VRAPASWNVWYRVAGSIATVALLTGAIELLKPYVPVLSLGVLYIFAVLPVAIAFGLTYAVSVAVGSMLAFNFFFLPPLYTLTLQDSRNWFALAVFLVTAVVVSELAARSRRQADESALLARMATSLLERGDVAAQLDAIAREVAATLGVRRARITLDPDERPGPNETADPLVAGEHRLGTLFLPSSERQTAGRRRVVPALASLLAVAIDRERLAAEAYDAEALRRSDAVKTAVIQAVSHDLRTPLATIETALGSLRDATLALDDTDRAELLDAIAVELERLKRLVENLLDLSRLQAGAADPVPELWTAEQLVGDALDEVDGDRVQVVLDDDLPVVRVDGVQIQRVLVNLLENALKFSPAPEPVQLRANRSRGEVVIRVTNRGRGIPQAELGRIFEPFQRVVGERTGGAGLGLAIAKGFTEANGGRIWAESRPGQGATFVLVLPAVEAPALVTT